MPVYRSFVTCDDPKGVADCKTVAKSNKARQKKLHKTSTSSNSKEEGGLCFQVMEVSRGAERLSKAVERPHTSTDLLRGALHLQHSLVMFGKLHKEKRPLDLLDDNLKPRVSASRDCYDELRDVIRESFARLNLLPKEKLVCDADRKHSELCVDLPSSSSSQTSSSLLHSGSSGSPSIWLEKKSNLIAKLMGLEEAMPLKAGDGAFLKERRSPFLDIHLPRPNNKPQFKLARRETRTLEEIIETMQFKGILGRKSLHDYKLHSNALFLRNESAVDTPPIVIMEPLRVRADQCTDGGEHLKSRQTPRKTGAELPPRPELKAKKPNEKSAVDHSSKQKLDKRTQARPVKKAALDSLSTTRTSQPKPLPPQIQKKEVPKIRKPKDAKPQRSDKTQNVTKLAAVKTVRGNNVSKSLVAIGKVAAADKGMKPTPLSRTVPKKSPRKGESNSKPSPHVVETIVSEFVLKNTEPKQATEEVAKAYNVSDSSTNATSSPRDASDVTSKDDPHHIENDTLFPSLDSDQIKGCKILMNSRYLLLRSASFLNHVEELFDTGTHDSTVFQNSVDSEGLYDALLLDCAKEILERKSLSCRGTRNLWSQNLLRRPKYHSSIEQLVEEIADIIEGLQNYSEVCGNIVVIDSIYPMLDKDLRRNEEVTGAWDSGWRKGYAMEAVDEVMHEVEEQVLSEIVADVITEIMQ
ncbi:hypothetical protein SASPL_121072 [Salvia splendens]|uniref:DUF4378 domain-containing protein n=1 Tax=Salvia splendens TaxID=180675 RepID=A0A8X8XR82_SALSN|nr:uncharacterized protein LOC121740903 [Salvia splendens]KAG6418866.1 hypothetical protein SASPL_121072 [Salvia splendens]